MNLFLFAVFIAPEIVTEFPFSCVLVCEGTHLLDNPQLCGLFSGCVDATIPIVMKKSPGAVFVGAGG